MSVRTLHIAFLLLLAAACKKEENPFEGLPHDAPAPPAEVLQEGGFAWLHQRVFRPICANSGCHDGTFEPDFRSIGSAYNSLVFAPVIGNDPQNSYTYRVVPGDPQLSYLHRRLTSFVPNTSGIMPLETDGPDWPENQAQYIAAITSWIQSGALDPFGRPPVQGDMQPQVQGFAAFPAGNTSAPFPRGTGAGVQPIEVPAGIVDLWFSVTDDNTPVTGFTHNTMRIASSAAAFATVPEHPLSTSTTMSAAGFGGGTVTFTHKGTIDLSAQSPGSVLFVRIYVDDGAHDGAIETPNDGTGSPMVNYFTLRIAS